MKPIYLLMEEKTDVTMHPQIVVVVQANGNFGPQKLGVPIWSQ